MPTTVSRLLILAAAILFLLCPLTFLAGTFAPRTLGFLDPLVCPDGYRLDNQTDQYSAPGSYSVSVTMVCRSQAGRVMDATFSMLLILFALPVFGFLCYLASAKLKQAYGKE
jgi:hypothetical protein